MSSPFPSSLLAAQAIQLVNFPSIRPSKSVPFTLYSRDVASTSDLTKQQTLIAGETEDVEFFSTNRDRQTGAEGGDCQYVPLTFTLLFSFKPTSSQVPPSIV